MPVYACMLGLILLYSSDYFQQRSWCRFDASPTLYDVPILLRYMLAKCYLKLITCVL